jgi:hypothetical protein
MNSSNVTLQWLNIAVQAQPAYAGGSIDLNDNRVGAPLDPIPTFITMSLESCEWGQGMHRTRHRGPSVGDPAQRRSGRAGFTMLNHRPGVALDSGRSRGGIACLHRSHGSFRTCH